jgi:hypothetical protein
MGHAMANAPQPLPMTNDEFLELIGLLYEGPVAADPWQGFAEGLRQRLNARAVIITLHHARGDLCDISVTAQEPGHFTDWTAVEMIYREKYMAADPFRYDAL